jgi:predicted transcriptional regulator
LLHPVEGETTKKTINQAPGTDDSKTQLLARTSSVAGSAMVAHVQTMQAKVSHAFNVLLTTTWVDLHDAAKGRRVKVYALLDQDATISFISESLCQILRIKQQCRYSNKLFWRKL